MTPLQEPKALDFAGLLALSLMWGSAFFFTEIALTSFGPLTVAAGRITVAALFLAVIATARGHRLPRRSRDIGLLFLAGVTGATLPFSLISWGQTEITSSMAAILMAFMPLSTVLLAHLMTRDETLTAGKLAGVLIGLAGVVVLVGGVSLQLLSRDVLGQLAVLAGTVGYAVSSLLLRRVTHLPTLVNAAAVMITAAVTTVPVALALEAPWRAEVSLAALGALVTLGLFPSAVAVIILVKLLGRVGATFVSLNNYLVPVVGTVLGVAFLDEGMDLSKGAGLALILLGVLVTQQVQRRQTRRQRT